MKKCEDVQLRIKRYKPMSKYSEYYNSFAAAVLLAWAIAFFA